MIIFDLDGTLADCEHRQHFVDPSKSNDAKFIYDDLDDLGQCLTLSGNYYFKGAENKWKPDWKSFYEACDKDSPIQPVIDTFKKYFQTNIEVQIWSGRCESIRQKTLEWLDKNISISYFKPMQYFDKILKMRPIGDNTPDDQLKEKWLDEASICVNELSGRISQRNPIEFVFDSGPKSIAMWKRRGIFVFDVNQCNAP